MSKKVYVEGHQRNDGSWVKAHYREVEDNGASDRADSVRDSLGDVVPKEQNNVDIYNVKGLNGLRFTGEGDAEIEVSDFSECDSVVVHATPGDNGGVYIRDTKVIAKSAEFSSVCTDTVVVNTGDNSFVAGDSELIGVYAESAGGKLEYDKTTVSYSEHHHGPGRYTRCQINNAAMHGKTTAIDSSVYNSTVASNDTYIKDSRVESAVIENNGGTLYMEKGIVDNASITPGIEGAELKLNNACITDSEHFYGFRRKSDGAVTNMYRGYDGGTEQFVVMQTGTHVLRVKPSTLENPTTGDLYAMQKITAAENHKAAYDAVVRAMNSKPRLMDPVTDKEREMYNNVAFQGRRA
mgnify:FL=1